MKSSYFSTAAAEVSYASERSPRPCGGMADAVGLKPTDLTVIPVQVRSGLPLGITGEFGTRKRLLKTGRGSSCGSNSAASASGGFAFLTGSAGRSGSRESRVRSQSKTAVFAREATDKARRIVNMREDRHMGRRWLSCGHRDARRRSARCLVCPMSYSSLIDQHVEEASFLWEQRCLAAQRPHYRLADLAELELRLEAHLEALVAAQQEGLRRALGAVGVQASAGFAATVVCMRQQRWAEFADVLRTMPEQGDLFDAVQSAICWATASQRAPVLEALVGGQQPSPLKRLGLVAVASSNTDPGEIVEDALGCSDPLLRAEALRVIGSLKLAKWSEHVDDALDSDDRRCRYQAARAAVLLGIERGQQALARVIEANDSRQIDRCVGRPGTRRDAGSRDGDGGDDATRLPT